MKSTTSEKFTIALADFLKKIGDHCVEMSKIQQPFGICTASPKFLDTPELTKEIRAQLQSIADKYFTVKQLGQALFRYSVPPIMPIREEENASSPTSVSDYQLTFSSPQFDPGWLQIVASRSLIYCSSNPRRHEYIKWFELQEEAIRMSPTVHQTVRELEIISHIERSLNAPALAVFEPFIYKYGLRDKNNPISSKELESWKKKEIRWQKRYALAVPIIESAKTVYDLYIIARQKFTSSRNPTLKSLFSAFTQHVEVNLITKTPLPEKIKKTLLDRIQRIKKRPPKKKYVAKKSPAVCISDVECGLMLYILASYYLNQNDQTLAEAMFFIWIAQHGAFSGHHLTIDEILSLKV